VTYQRSDVFVERKPQLSKFVQLEKLKLWGGYFFVKFALNVFVNAEMEDDSPPDLVDVEGVSTALTPDLPNGQLQLLQREVQELQLSRVPITIVTGMVKLLYL
jgi:hypothetical protein